LDHEAPDQIPVVPCDFTFNKAIRSGRVDAHATFIGEYLDRAKPGFAKDLPVFSGAHGLSLTKEVWETLRIYPKDAKEVTKREGEAERPQITIPNSTTISFG